MNKHVEPPERSDTRAAAPLRQRGGLSARRSAERFKAAHRHSRRVRFFRRALPLAVLLALGGTLAVNYLDPFNIAVDLPFDLGRVSLSGTQVKMEFPRLHGFTSDNRGYSVSAESASQDLTSPDSIELQKIVAKLEMADKGWADLTASTGQYDTKTEQLELGGGVRFQTSSGYGGDFQDAQIEIKTGKLTSDKPVKLTYLDGQITADRIEVSQKDSRALLTGNVQLDFKMPPSGDDGAATAPELRGGTPPDASARPAPGPKVGAAP